MAEAVYNTAEWRRVRRLVLERDGYTCQTCGGPGNAVDHIIPWRDGGDLLSPLNLRCLCIRCNAARVHVSKLAKSGVSPSRRW